MAFVEEDICEDCHSASMILLEMLYQKPYDEVLKEEDMEDEMLESVRSYLAKKKKHDQSQTKKAKIAVQIGKKQSRKRKIIERDDTEETLELLLHWKNNTPRTPPGYILDGADLADQCSEPIHKQLTSSDVKEDQCRLMLGKKQTEKMMSQVLEELERPGANGIEVSVYGPVGQVYEMMFKMWNGDTPVLTGKGWNQYWKRYGLVEIGYFLRIWMFRHKETRNLCFAIDFDPLPIRTMLSRRTLTKVFEDQN